MMAHSHFSDASALSRFILYADAVLVTFFFARVLIHEVGAHIMIPLVIAGGVLLILLDNRRFARAVAGMAIRLNPDITHHRIYAVILRAYGEGLHWITGAVMVGTAAYSLF